MTLELTFLPSLGAPFLDIFDEDDALLASGVTEQNLTTLTHTDLQQGPRTIRVSGKGLYRGAYTLRVRTDSAEDACSFDHHEPDSESPSTLTVPNALVKGAICGEDLDVFLLPLQSGQSVELVLDFSEGLGDLDLDLVDPQDNVVASARASAAGRSKEVLGADIVATGLYKIHISPTEGGQQAIYTLASRTLEAIDCEDDLQEPNNDENTARVVAPGLHLDLHSCSGDEDWYALEVEEGQTLSINMAYPRIGADVEVELLDANSQLIQGSYSTDGRESIIHTAGSTQIHFIRVVTPGRGAAPYVMDLTID